MAISGRVGIYEKGIKKSECILWDMDSGIIFVQKLGLRKAAMVVHSPKFRDRPICCIN